MSTRLEIRNKCIQMAFIRTDKNDALDAAINDTLKEMASSIEPRKLQDQIFVPCIVGQEDYALPDTMLRIRHPARIIDPDEDTNNSSSHHPIQFISKVEYDFWEPNPNASNVQTSRPWAYTIWKNCLLLTDVPDKKYKVELNIGGVSVTLDADGDEMIFQDQWLETVCAGTLARAFLIVKKYTDVAVWKDIYVNGFTGTEFSGGLKLIKSTERDVQDAPMLIRNNNL